MASQRLPMAKKMLFAALAVVACLLMLEGLASYGWFVVEYAQWKSRLPKVVVFQEEHHARHDPELGWVHIPDTHIDDFYGPGMDITINRDGFRGLEDYISQKPEGRFRVVCLGDSFTLGYGVGDRSTFPAQLERIRPGVQAVNMGQGAYSVGQCYLWYRRTGDALEPNCLVFTMIVDDLWRMMGDRMANGYGKPVFGAKDGQLEVSGLPVPEKIETGMPLVSGAALTDFIRRHHATSRTAMKLFGREAPVPSQYKSAELIEVGLVVLSRLQEQARKQGCPMLLVLLPELVELQTPARREGYQSISRIFADFARNQGLLYVDAYADFVEGDGRDVSRYYLPEHQHHLSDAGNELVALLIDRILSQYVSGYPQVRSAQE